MHKEGTPMSSKRSLPHILRPPPSPIYKFMRKDSSNWPRGNRKTSRRLSGTPASTMVRAMTRPQNNQLCTPHRSSRSLSPAEHCTDSDKFLAAVTHEDPGRIYRCASDANSLGVITKMDRTNSMVGGARVGTNPALIIVLVPTLTPSQVVIIRRSWKHVHTKGLYEVVRKCYQKLESRHPSVKHAFASVSCSRTVNNLQQHLYPHVVGMVCPKATNVTLVPTSTLPQEECSRPSTSTSASPTPKTVAATITTPALKVKNITDHTRFFLNLLDRIIEGASGVDTELKNIGAKHVHLHDEYGFGTAEIERLGEIFAEAFYKLDGIRESKEATKAWRILIAKIIGYIRDGFEAEHRLHRRKLSAIVNGTGQSHKRNSMPSPQQRKTSLRVELEQITRKLSNI